MSISAASKKELEKAEIAAQKWIAANPNADGKGKMRAVEEILCGIGTWPTQSRPNVSPNENPVTGLVFGAVYVLGGKGMQTSQCTQHCKCLAKLMVDACKETIPLRDGKRFPFSSIQVNYNYAAKKHVDGNNIGPSYIMSLGEHSGGSLWVADTFVEDDGIMRGGGGEAVVDCHRNWCLFNGCAEHYTQAFAQIPNKKLQRISLVCFSHSKYNHLPQEVATELDRLGFEAVLCNGEELDFFKSFRLDKAELAGEALDEYMKIREKRRALRPRDDTGTVCVEAHGLTLGRGAGFISIARGAAAKKRRIDAFFVPQASATTKTVNKPVQYELPKKNKNSVATRDVEATIDDAGLLRIELPKNRTGLWVAEINPNNYTLTALERFDVYAKTKQQSTAFANYVNALAPNTVVCIGITDTAMAATRPLPPSVYDTLRKLGGPKHLEPIGYRQPFCFIGAKDLPIGDAVCVLEKTKVIVRVEARIVLNSYDAPNGTKKQSLSLTDKHIDLFDVTAHITKPSLTTSNDNIQQQEEALDHPSTQAAILSNENTLPSLEV